MHLHSTKNQVMWNTFADATKKRDSFTLGLFAYLSFLLLLLNFLLSLLFSLYHIHHSIFIMLLSFFSTLHNSLFLSQCALLSISFCFLLSFFDWWRFSLGFAPAVSLPCAAASAAMKPVSAVWMCYVAAAPRYKGHHPL